MDVPPSYGTLLDARARNHLYMRWASQPGAAGEAAAVAEEAIK